jgi:hypothetical protein
MMALQAHARGGPEQLVYEPAPVPAARPGEALCTAAITLARPRFGLMTAKAAVSGDGVACAR